MKFDSNKQVESRLDLKPIPELYNLALVELESVEVTDHEILAIDDKGKESANEFKGLIVPRIALTWKNHKLTETEEDRFFTLSFSVIVSVKNDGTPISKKDLQSLYETMHGNLQHIHNSYKKCPNYKPIISLPDIDETSAPNARAKQFKTFFVAFQTAFNGAEGKTPIYQDEKGINIISWLKLLPDYKTQSRYTTPTFVGQGFTEVAVKEEKGWKKPLIEIKPNESLELQAKAKKGKTDVSISTSQGELDPELQKILDNQK